MEGNNRRKSKITFINNDFLDEDPIYVCNYEEEVPKENKKPRNRKKNIPIELLSNDSDVQDAQIGEKSKIQNSNTPSKKLHEHNNDLRLNNIDNFSKYTHDAQHSNFGKIEIDGNSKTQTTQQSTRILHESGKDLDLCCVDSPSKSPKQTAGHAIDVSDLWQPVVVLEKMLLENGNQQPYKSSHAKIKEEASTPKTPHRKNKIEPQNVSGDLNRDTDVSSAISTNQSIKGKKTVAKTPTESTRRSGRVRKLSTKALEASQYRDSPVIRSASSSSENEFELDSDIEKPTTLFESKDVEGKEIYGFQTPRRRNALLQKALSAAGNSPISVLQKETAKISLTPRTPKSTSKKYESVKTPAAVRSKLRKNLENIVREIEDEEFSDFSLSESDYVQSSSSSSESDSSATEEQKSIPITPKHIRNVRLTRKNQKDITYTLQSDEYFSTQSSKLFTSDNTLDKLKNPRLTQDKINDILQNVKTNREHAKRIAELSKEYEMNFEKWLCLMYEGDFSILIYGVGSKRTILEHFRLYLQNEKYPVIFINGFFPSLVIKDVIDVIVNDLLRLKDVSSNPLEVVDEIEQFLNNNDEIHMFLIVCNIDGEMLRSSKAQNILSKLASIRNIHLIASIDDINAPLIWDHRKLNRYNFTWWDTTTFLPYADETSFEGSLLVQKSGMLTLSSLKNIFQSLTTNARGIFNIIIKHHLDNKKDTHYQGISFKDLYWLCRESFLVSSDIALRAQLTEFLDHKLIKSKRNLDGAELLHIPIEGTLLQHFLDHE